MANKMRLIDADALKRQFIYYVRTEPHFHWGDWQNMCINGNEIDEVIANTSTVDAAPVVHGRFANVQELGDGICVGFCSNCMTPHKANNLTALRMGYRHCRWCGANMDGGNGDGKAD